MMSGICQSKGQGIFSQDCATYTTKKASDFEVARLLAGGPGLEPGLMNPESTVLPIKLSPNLFNSLPQPHCAGKVEVINRDLLRWPLTTAPRQPETLPDSDSHLVRNIGGAGRSPSGPRIGNCLR